MLGIDFKKISLRRNPLTYVKVQTALSPILRGRRLFIKSPAEGDYLNVGCGPYMHPDFCNLDWHWAPGVQVCWDIRKPLPIMDQQVAGVFSEHCVEHISFDDFIKFSRELYRIMKPGAYARIIVPDAELYLTKYQRHLNGQEAGMPYAESDVKGGVYTPLMSINRIMHNFGHQFIYDFETMRSVLVTVGFREVNKCQFGQGSDPRLLIDQPWRAVESLYVEARR